MTGMVTHVDRARARAVARLSRLRGDEVSAIPLFLKDEETNRRVKLAELHLKFLQAAQGSDRAVVWGSPGTGKSSILVVGHTLFELARDPSLRVVILSNTSTQAEKSAGLIQEYIEKDVDYRALYPHVRPGPKWQRSSFTIRRETRAKDPSVRAVGAHGALTSARVDLLIIDDLDDFESVRTQGQRDQMWSWLQSNAVMGRMSERGRVLVLGNAMHPDDTMHRLAKVPGYKAVRLPIWNQKEDTSAWPGGWPIERIHKVKAELIPIEQARQLLCQARSDTDSRFRDAWLDAALERGRGRVLGADFDPPDGVLVATGVDLGGIKQKTDSDQSSISTIAYWPPTHDGGRWTTELLALESGRWHSSELVRRLRARHARYGGYVSVESNGGQMFLTQQVEDEFPVHAHTTGRNKENPIYGFEALATDFFHGDVVLPCQGGAHPEVSGLYGELRDYHPLRHTGDRAMAFWIAWHFLRRLVRTGVAPQVSVRVIGARQ